MESNASSQTASSGAAGGAASFWETYKDYIKGTGTEEDPYTYSDIQNSTTYVYNSSTGNWDAKVDYGLLYKQRQAMLNATPAAPSDAQSQQPASTPSTADAGESAEPKKKSKKREAAEKAQNSNIYITGLPPDVDVDEIESFCQKCGIIKKDAETALPKIKVYTDDEGRCKGDALVTYFRPESVALAVNILDDADVRPGVRVHVQKAEFAKQQGGKAKKPAASSKKHRPKSIKLYDQAQELSWEEDDRVNIILQNVFTQDEAWEDASFFDELKEELEAECSKYGEIKNVKIFEFNPKGVVAVKYAGHAAAVMAIEKLDGRFFGGRKLEVDFYDGWTDYNVKESEEHKEWRIAKFGEWLGGEDDGKPAEQRSALEDEADD